MKDIDCNPLVLAVNVRRLILPLLLSVTRRPGLDPLILNWLVPVNVWLALSRATLEFSEVSPEPSPVKMARNVGTLSSTESVLVPLFAQTKSTLPSPLTSAAATELG